jgi:ribonuclease VapC
VIVADTSAIVAVFKGEPEADLFAATIADADVVAVSAATLLEASMVLGNLRSTLEPGDEWLDRFIAESHVRIEPVTAEQAQIARLAFRQFGKGTGNGAGLNFGDCFAYALAKSLDAPLLYKGDDFGKTDIASALA